MSHNIVLMIYPLNSLFFSSSINGSVSNQIAITADSANPITVLSVKISSKIADNAKITCGPEKIARSYSTDYATSFPYVVCTDDVTLSTGNANTKSFFAISYAPYNVSEVAGAVVQTSNPFTLESSYTFGELTIALILIPLLLLTIYTVILKAFRKNIVWHK